MPGKSSAASAKARDIEHIREFNRFYTRQLGLLDRGLLGSRFTLTECRVLYELAHRQRCTAAQISRDLKLDFGYLSRLLKKFQRRHLIERRRSTSDARQVFLRLTQAGRAAFGPLDRAAISQVAGMTADMDPTQRVELVGAMQIIRRQLESSADTLAGPLDPSQHQPRGAAAPYQIRGLKTGDLGWITHRQGLLYAQEYGWDGTYEALVAEILGSFVKHYKPGQEVAWIAERDGIIIGSAFLVRESATVAKLRLLYVEPSARGLGLGRQLVRLCIEFAHLRGYTKLSLWTNGVLVSARRIYEAAGFKLVREEPHHSFGKDLVGQTWELALPG
jgi:DNA-binding MarR family transcriptional regulator/GNAT superfamily N-acetyltransferase